MADTLQIITRTPSATAPTRIVAQKGVRYEIQDPTLNKQGPASLRAKRVGQDLSISFGDSAQADVVVEGFYNPDIMANNPASVYGRGPDGLLYEYFPENKELTGMTSGLVDGASPVSQVLGGSPVAGLAGAEVGALLPVVAALNPLTAVLIGVGVAAAAGGGGGGVTLDTARPSAPVLALGAGVSGGATEAEAIAAGGVVTVNGALGSAIVVTFTNGTQTVTKTLTGTGAAQAVTLAAGDLGTGANQLANGTIRVSVVATDAAGNPSTPSTTSFTLDTAAPTPPTLALGTGVSGGASSAEAVQATGVVTVNAENGATTVVTFKDSLNHTVTKTVTGTGSAQAVTLSAADLGAGANQLADGNITVSVVATDAAGNPSTPSTTSFALDTAAPSPPTLALGTGVSNGATTAEATAAAGVVSVSAENGATTVVTFTDTSGHTVTKTVAGTGAAQAVTLAAGDLGTGANQLANGTITVSVVATDAAGNPSTPSTTSFILDTAAPTPPTVALGTGVTDVVNKAEATLASGALRVSAENGASTVVTFTDSLNHTVTKTVTGTGSAQAITLAAGDLGAGTNQLADGTITVSVVATDAAGNPSTAGTTSFTLDATAPTPTLVSTGNFDLTLSSNSNCVIRSSEAGTAYLVVSTVTVTSEASILALANTQYKTMSIAANTDTNLSLTGLLTGAFKLYTVDAEGNLSAGTSNTIGVYRPVYLSAVTSGTGGFVINGQAANDLSGYSVSNAGDVNGDGLADVIVGAYGANTSSGKSYVVFGRTGTSAIDLSAVAAGTGGFVINGQAANDYSGLSVSTAGDFNGDGLADLIVGAYGANATAGKSYVVFGRTGTSAIDLSAVADGTGGFVINGQTKDNFSGYSVSNAGDVNGDGGLNGELEHLSPDTLKDERQPRKPGANPSDMEEGYYRILVRIKDTNLVRKGKMMAPTPGMTATVEIRTGQKTVLEYLFRPLQNVTQALRER